MKLIVGTTAPDVWVQAAEHLLGCPSHEDYDVFLHIATPTALSSEDRVVVSHIDDFLVRGGGYSINTVAETIFPFSEYVRGGSAGVFENYPEKIRAIHKGRSDRGWGCYALRLLRQTDHQGRTFNPLKELVAKIRDHGNYRACNELGLGQQCEEDIPIYDPATDRRPLYGRLPCLSHISVKVHDGAIRLNATYRAHNYVQRLLGNLFGLAQLQAFIALETALAVGPLTINSTFARLDTGRDNGADRRWTLREVKVLLANCRTVYGSAKAA